eukprot:EG_transcript_15788
MPPRDMVPPPRCTALNVDTIRHTKSSKDGFGCTLCLQATQGLRAWMVRVCSGTASSGRVNMHESGSVNTGEGQRTDGVRMDGNGAGTIAGKWKMDGRKDN